VNILVTGGAGYIGSMLVPRLLLRGHIVTVVDNFMYGQTPLMRSMASPALTIVRYDVCRKPLDISGFDMIIPLAAIVGADAVDRNVSRAYDVNVRQITQLRIDGEKLVKTPIIIPITNSGYGIGTKGVECTETSGLYPVSEYGKQKLAAEAQVMRVGNAISLRLATVFGASPRMRLDLLVNDFVYQAVTRGSIVLFESAAMRNYVHIRDVCSAFVHCIDNFDTMKDNIYNVGDTRANMSKLDLARKIREHVPGFEVWNSLSGSDPDKRDYIVSNAKLEATGWSPRFSIDDGIKELIKAYQIVRKNQFGNVED